MRLAVVVPVLNEAATIDSALRRLAPLRDRGTRVIVVDGGSDDGTAACAAPLADRVLAAPRGRAAQMNAGAQDALARQADVLLFLHADTRLPEDADRVVARALADGAHSWGRFDVRLDADGWSLRLIETMMNWRSRATGIATGDQAIFATRAAFDWLHGFAPHAAGGAAQPRRHLGAALAAARAVAHRAAHVVAAPVVLLRRRPAGAGPPLPRCPLSRQSTSRYSLARRWPDGPRRD